MHSYCPHPGEPPDKNCDLQKILSAAPVALVSRPACPPVSWLRWPSLLFLGLTPPPKDFSPPGLVLLLKATQMCSCGSFLTEQGIQALPSCLSPRHLSVSQCSH